MITPIFQVTVDGNDITAAAQSRMLSLTVRDNAGEEADSFEMVLDDGDGRNVPHLPIPPPEAVFVVEMGYKETGLSRMGRFIVNEIEFVASPV